MRYLLFLALLYLTVPAALPAQQVFDTAWIAGQVLDQQGFPLVGVNVVAKLPSDHRIMGGAGSDRSGKFQFHIPAGTYQLGCTRFDYKSYFQEQLTIAPGDTAMLQIQMEGAFTIDSVPPGFSYPPLYGFWEAEHIRFDVGDRLRFPNEAKIGLEFSPAIQGIDLGKGTIIAYDGCNYTGGWFFQVLSTNEMSFYHASELSQSTVLCEDDYELMYPDQFLYLFELLSKTEAPVQFTIQGGDRLVLKRSYYTLVLEKQK